MTKTTKCHECWGLQGRHEEYCQSRGYAAVGPHPDAEPATQRAPVTPPVQCPCGIAKLDCTYHRHEVRAPARPDYEVYDADVYDVRVDGDTTYVTFSGDGPEIHVDWDSDPTPEYDTTSRGIRGLPTVNVDPSAVLRTYPRTKYDADAIGAVIREIWGDYPGQWGQDE